METRSVGSLSVSVIGLGCNQIGTTCDQARSNDIVAAAIDQGITLFDTADEYGDGSAEEVLGRALGGRRDKVVIATKFGARISGDPRREGASSRWISIAIEDSLRRLNTDYIDLYQLHFPDTSVPIEETLETLNTLIAAGKVREIGCCNLSREQLAAAASTDHGSAARTFASLQCRLNLLRQENLTDLGPTCARYGMKILPYFPLASGVLTGKYRRGQPPPRGTRLADNVPADVAQKVLSDRTFDAIEALEAFATARGHTLPELAIAWLISQDLIGSVIAGATSANQVAANVSSANWRLTTEEISAVSRLVSA